MKVLKNVLSKFQSGNTKGLQPLFHISFYIHHYKLYRFLGLTKIGRRILGMLIGKCYLEKIPSTRTKVLKSLSYLLPRIASNRIGEKWVKKVYRSWIFNSGTILVDIMLHLPSITSKTLDRFVDFKNLEFLDEALSKRKGAIIASVHTSNIFYVAAGLSMHPHNYEVVGVANMKNQKLFRRLLKDERMKNFHLVGTTNYGDIKNQLENHLKNGRIVIIMCDFSHKGQLHVPFWYGKLPYLVPFPQSPVALRLKTGAPIIPVLIKSDGRIGKSILEFKNPLPISEWLPEVKMLSESPLPSQIQKETFIHKIHGEASLMLNSVFAPHLIKNCHLWTEIRQFYGKVRDEFHIKSEDSPIDIVELFESRLERYLVGTYDRQIPSQQRYLAWAKIETILKDLRLFLKEQNCHKKRGMQGKIVFVKESAKERMQKLTDFVSERIKAEYILKKIHQNLKKL